MIIFRRLSSSVDAEGYSEVGFIILTAEGSYRLKIDRSQAV